VQRQLERELMDQPQDARDYAAAKFPQVMQAVLDRLFALTADRSAARMVDLGTGPASIPIALAKARPNWQITAVEAAGAMVKIAQIATRMAGVHQQVQIRSADAKATGLPQASFDIVFCNNMLHHMPDAAPLWDEIKRLAAPRATILVRDLIRPTSEQAAHLLVDRSGQPNKKDHFASLLAAFEVDEVRQQLVEAGLDFLRVDVVSEEYFDISGTMPG
jgi:ubiquinone/menaquinone biosynthesis C-methylase UbiE